MLSAGDVRGTVENSKSEFSSCDMFPRDDCGLGFLVGPIFNLEKAEAVSDVVRVVFGLLSCGLSLEVVAASSASLLSLSSVSLRRKSTHKSAKDCRRGKGVLETTLILIIKCETCLKVISFSLLLFVSDK